MNVITDIFEVDNQDNIVLEVMGLDSKRYYMLVKNEDYKRWEEGAYVQDAFPYLSPEQREILISGITPKMWDEMIGDEI